MRFLPKLPAVEMQRVASLGSASRLIGITFGLMALATFAVHTEHLVQHRAGSATALLTLAIVFCAALVSGVVGFACSALAGAGLVHLYARPSDVIGLMLLCSIAIQHADKGLTFSIDGDPGLAWQIDEGDAFELLGNVMDNAAKWARQRVAVAAWRSDDGLHLRVDDGPRLQRHAVGAAIARAWRRKSSRPRRRIGGRRRSRRQPRRSARAVEF